MAKKKNKNIIITGGSGMLADYFRIFGKKNRYLFLDHKTLDVSSWKSVKDLRNREFSAVIHLASKTDVDWCEKNQKEAYGINTLSVKYLAEICAKKKVPLIYTSTSAVFNGKSEIPYTEFDKTSPANYYAFTKLEGEKFLKENHDDYAIVRLGWLIGTKKKFLYYMLKQIYEGKKEIYAINDIHGTITYAYGGVRFIEQLLENREQGLFHLASKGSCSRYQITKNLVKLLGKRVRVIPVKNAFFARDFPAPRPKNESIISLRRIYGFEPLESWSKTIEKVIKKEKLKL